MFISGITVIILVGVIGAGIGYLIHKYGFATVESAMTAEAATAVADVKADLAAVGTAVAADYGVLATKVQTLLTKLGL